MKVCYSYLYNIPPSSNLDGCQGGYGESFKGAIRDKRLFQLKQKLVVMKDRATGHIAAQAVEDHSKETPKTLTNASLCEEDTLLAYEHKGAKLSARSTRCSIIASMSVWMVKFTWTSSSPLGLDLRGSMVSFTVWVSSI